MSPIENRLNDELKAAMRAKDRRTLALVRMLKARMTERRTRKGFDGAVDDALWLEVIGAYQKSLKKAVTEFQKAASGAEERIEALQWEIARLDDYLPSKADEATVRGWVEAAIAGLGGAERARLGPVIGVVMKAHKAEVDAAVVRAAAQALLS